MKFFVDTAEIDQIKELNDLGMVDGVTTNPSLIKKSGRDIIEVTKEICSIVDGPVSAEVTSTEADTMIAEGRKLVTIAKNIKNENDFFTWEQVALKIQILSEYLRTNLADGDRCILLSENRPEWLISDISIMNAGGVTVPLFTTYSEKDYEYIINDCKPKICIVSNEIQLKKIKK